MILVMETRVLKLRLVLEVAIFGRSNWSFPAGHLPFYTIALVLYVRHCFQRIRFQANNFMFTTVILAHMEGLIIARS